MIGKVFVAACVGVIALVGIGTEAYGQDATALAAALDKNKYKKKDKSKNGVDVSVEVYIDIKNVPAVKEPAAYSGRYGDDWGTYRLSLRVAADGSAEGTGSEVRNGGQGDERYSYTLRNARVTGAVLTGDKVFSDGKTERFEGVFVNRTTLSGQNAGKIDSKDLDFGLGFVQRHGDSTNRVFMKQR